ncbi:MAG: cytochrome c biogenesis protein DipZ [Solirubrobacterales bacterium]
MAALIVFAFLAGAGTALSPCVLPVLPVVLSAGVTGGRRRPLGIVVGLVLSFTFAILALVYVIDALGLPDDLLRNLAIVVLAGFGLTLLVPSLAARLEAWISRFVPQTSARKGDGFGSGLLVGLSLGVLYAPCAGPILAGVITVSASQSLTTSRLAVAFAYALGSAVVLYFLLLGGRRLTSRIGRHSGQLQMAMGALMVLVALLMLGDYDTRFQTAIANDLPAIVVNPTKELEERGDVRSQLSGLRDEVADSPVYGIAPELTGNQQWFNTPGDKPLSLRQLRGRVVLIDFWTYTCINCIRTLPYLKAWDEAYRDKGLTIIGVHTPEFPFERDADNGAAAIEQNGLRYPVVQDNDYATWNAYGNQYWPSKYLVDARGRVRYAHFGEGEYDETEKVIRELLAEAGRRPGAKMTHVAGEQASAQVTTPETYLGAARAERFANGPIVLGAHRYRTPPRLAPDQLAYGGSWRIQQDSAVAGTGARLDLEFGARRVFLVLGSEGDAPRRVRVLLDGEPIATRDAGRDVHDGEATITGQRLYRLVELPRAGRHRLSLELAPGVSGYAFTFG